MAYTAFSLNELEVKFGITFHKEKLFENIQPCSISTRLKEALEDATLFHLTSEKIKSEAVVFPIMAEIKRRNKDRITVFSGENLNADDSKGLVGECDFIISNRPELLEVETPIITLIEAKRDNLNLGIAQCSAQMIGSKVFNEKRNHAIDSIYGCVTNADDWQFLQLKNNVITLDTTKYYFNQIEVIIGIFQIIIDQQK